MSILSKKKEEKNGKKKIKLEDQCSFSFNKNERIYKNLKIYILKEFLFNKNHIQ